MESLFRRALGALTLLVVMTASVAAEDGWSLRVGAGAAAAAVYEGSDEYAAAPVPSVDVGWTRGPVSIGASTGGLGITCFQPDVGVLAGATVGLGQSRTRTLTATPLSPTTYSRRTERFLEDTPNVTGIAAADATLGYLTPVGIVAATVGYRPTLVEFTTAGRSDELYHAFLYSIFYYIGAPITEKLSIDAIVLVDAMDDRYAEAWYSLPDDTARLDSYDASAGLRSVQFVLEGSFAITEHLGASLMIGNTYLLGDAANAPFTRERLQSAVVIASFYEFK
jgi:hypothetical protein